ncbi:MAG: hypothetical protein HRU15_07990, partial [Planctomycetes bacterium]|nr:hypothetical protein [Planctomycetota bacterium]
PVIETPDNGVTAINADHKILVIGNAWFDANGVLWQELINTFHNRDEHSMHVECHCDDAATLQSIIANNAGELTQRQQDIMQHISNMQDRMGQLQLEHDRFDGLADYPVDRAFQFITDRKGKLDTILQQDIPWDTVIVQGFRGALDTEAHDFIASAQCLIDRVRQACPQSKILLMQHWAKSGSADDQDSINKSYEAISKISNIDLIRCGEAFAAELDAGLLSHDYTPNGIGIQVAAECIRQAIL